jgi:response regulator RpfG family c-di-GMP phosphodiesterase
MLDSAQTDIFGNIDTLLDSYDIQDDPILTSHWKAIETNLWSRIENYAEDINNYGTVMSQHLIRTSAVGMQFIVSELGFSERAGRNFYDANLLHDLGKTHPSYDPEIWQLPHRPTQEEREEKREHTQLGVELTDMAISKSPEALVTHPHIQIVQSLQRLHHERMDAEGYEGLDASKLGQVIQAICIIDAFDGDMIHRPHQPERRSPASALERMKTGKKYGGAFEPEILQRFIDFQLAAG